MKRPRGIAVAIGLCLFSFACLVLFWASWFLAPQLVQSRTPADPGYPSYVDFERAFLLADGWLALGLLTSAIGLWKMRPWGLLFSLLSAGSAVFLGLMDLLYNLQHGTFAPFTPDSLVALIVTILPLALSPTSVYLVWKHWRLFAQHHSALASAPAAPGR